MTNRMRGEPPRGTSSSVIDASASLSWTSALLLCAAGAAAAALHAATRGHLHLPGHQGLVWMALLGLVRASTGASGSASITGAGAGAAAALPFLGFHEPLAVTAYVVSGLAFDALVTITPVIRARHLRIGALAAVAFASKPLLQGLATAALGWRTPVATHGLIYPLALHLVFGFAGGFIGSWLWPRIAPARRRP